MGPECSLLVLCDGTRIAALAPAQDFKRIDDDDEGPNTGGMGAYSPVPLVDDRLIDRVLDQAVEPLVGALRRRGIDYRGVLYAGLILTVDGPRVLEYNVRFGDPETQVVLPRLTEDLTGLLAEAAAGRSAHRAALLAPTPSVCVVLAVGGLPRPTAHRRPHRRARGGRRHGRRHASSTPAPPSTTKAASSPPAGVSSA